MRYKIRKNHVAKKQGPHTQLMTPALSSRDRLSLDRSVGSWYAIFSADDWSDELNFWLRRKAEVFAAFGFVFLTSAKSVTRAPRCDLHAPWRSLTKEREVREREREKPSPVYNYTPVPSLPVRTESLERIGELAFVAAHLEPILLAQIPQLLASKVFTMEN